MSRLSKNLYIFVCNSLPLPPRPALTHFDPLIPTCKHSSRLLTPFNVIVCSNLHKGGSQCFTTVSRPAPHSHFCGGSRATAVAELITFCNNRGHYINRRGKLQREWGDFVDHRLRSMIRENQQLVTN